MLKKAGVILCSLMLIFTSGCGKTGDIPYDGGAERVQKSVRQVDKMPDAPLNYKYKDYLDTALKLDKLLYKFAEKPEYMMTETEGVNPSYAPVGYWTNSYNEVYKGKAFGVPSYIGHINSMGQGTVALPAGGSPEGVTTLGSLYGSSIAGIDKSAQEFTQEGGSKVKYNFVEMAKSFYSDEFILNRAGTKTGLTFWYEVYPQILFARIMNLYTADKATKDLIVGGAELWIEALDYFKDNGNGKFWYTSFNFMSMKPVLGAWAEPANGGIAFLLINAYRITGETKFLTAAKEYLDFCQQDIRNPNYEILTDYLPYTAAYMNLMNGSDYDVEKFLNFLFDADDDARPTGISRGKWGNYDANGLMAYDNWNNTDDRAWAFTMNTFHLASTIVPMLRYDTRFSDDIGKWMLNMTNSARIFYRDELDSAHRTKPDSLTCDPDGVVAYEGTSKYKRFNNGAEDNFTNDKYDKNISPYAMGDPTLRGWGKTDFGVYGGGHVGIVGGLVSETNVSQILRVNITKADDFKAKGDFQQYLYYNPYNVFKSVKLELGNEKYTLLDSVTQSVIERNATGSVNIEVPAKSSVIVVLAPQNASLSLNAGNFTCNGMILSKRENCSVSLEGSLESRMRIEDGKVFAINAQAFNGDKIHRLTVTLNGKTLYDDEYINQFVYDTSLVSDLDFTRVAGTYLEGGRYNDGGVIRYRKNFLEGELRFTVTTLSGEKDSTMIRVRKG